MLKWILIYALLSGLFVFYISYRNLNNSRESEAFRKDAEIVAERADWKVGKVYAVIYLVAFFFGWILLPFELIDRTIRIFKKGK